VSNEFKGRSQVAKDDLKTSKYQQPVGFRDGQPVYSKAELDAFDAGQADQRKPKSAAELEAEQMQALFKKAEADRRKAKLQEADQQQKETQAETEEDAFQAALSDLARKYYRDGARIWLSEGKSAFERWYATVDPDIKAHLHSEVEAAKAKVWPKEMK
jgi:hypothetical protein